MDGTGDLQGTSQEAHLAQIKIAFDPTLFRWSHIDPQIYKFALGDERGMGWRGVTRYTLLQPPAALAQFSLRYFELRPGGYSSFEKHAHVHAIVVLRGKGKAVIGQQVLDLAPFDLVYVPPNTPHRWINEDSEPFGFLCPVDATRDPGQPLTDAEWETLTHSPTTAPYAF